MAHAEPYASQVDRQQVIPDILRVIRNIDVEDTVDSSIVECYIETTEFCHTVSHHLRDLGPIGHVSLVKDGCSSIFPDPCSYCRASILAPSNEKYLGAFTSERIRRRFANAGAGASDENSLVLKAGHGIKDVYVGCFVVHPSVRLQIRTDVVKDPHLCVSIGAGVCDGSDLVLRSES